MSSEERRRSILEAALIVFSDRGFSGARTSEIAKTAGVSEALVFRHFRNKSEIYKSLFQYMMAEHKGPSNLFMDMVEKVDRGLDAIALIVRYIVNAGILHKKLNDPTEVRMSKLYFQNLIEGASFATELVENRHQKILPILENSIEIAREEGFDFHYGAKELFWFLHNFGSGIFVNSLSKEPELGLMCNTDQLDEAVNFVLKALGFSQEMIDKKYGEELWKQYISMVEL